MTRDDASLWLFADQLGRAVYGGEHAHREVLLIESTAALNRRRYQPPEAAPGAVSAAGRRPRPGRSPAAREMLGANHRTLRAVASMQRLTDLEAVLEQESGRDRF